MLLVATFSCLWAGKGHDCEVVRMTRMKAWNGVYLHAAGSNVQLFVGGVWQGKGSCGVYLPAVQLFREARGRVLGGNRPTGNMQRTGMCYRCKGLECVTTEARHLN